MTRSPIRRPIADVSWPGTTRRAGTGPRVVIGVTHVGNLLCADACYAASAQMAAGGLSHSARQLRDSARPGGHAHAPRAHGGQARQAGPRRSGAVARGR